jgi:ketosteroid isomerase-like protein
MRLDSHAEFKRRGNPMVQDFEVFEPREFVAQGDKVITLGHYTAKVKATGRRFDSDFVMVFTLRNGKLTHFQEFLDTASLNAAF